MAIIAMTHEMGSLGSTIARTVAEKLGYTYLRQDIIREAAREFHVVEEKLREAVEARPGLFEMVRESARRSQIFITAEVYEEALKDNVIIMGRWSTILLRGVPHAVCIRTLSPLNQRIQRIAEREQITEEKARRRIARYDEGVRYRIKQFFDVEWEDPTLYDLSLNTGRLSVETAIAQVAELATSAEFGTTPEGITIVQNLALGARTRAELKSRRETSHIDIEAEADRGVVTLRGTVFAPEERTAAEAVAKGVKGIQRVINTLTVVKMGPY